MFEPLPPAKIWREREHWCNAAGTSFKNPWSSFNPAGASKWDLLKGLLFHPRKIPVPDNIHEIYRVVEPTWSSFEQDKVRATWLGHATFVVELPKQDPSHERGIRILFDPVFSTYTSPAWAVPLGLGPKRYSKLPCTVEELPEIDVVCLSHNHYDHLDLSTVRRLEARTAGTMQYVCGLNNRRHFLGFGVSQDRVFEMDWGENLRVSVPSLRQDFCMSCCPAQHTSARTLTDTDRSLWCSWLVQTPGTGTSDAKRVYFLGDTGYRYTKTEDRAGWPTCPIFKQIGETFAPIDLAMIPIGLYSPRNLLSNVHLCPEDSVAVHRDIRARLSIGMHFGTFRGGLSRNFEDVLEPPRRLGAALDACGISRDAFVTIDIGGSVDV